MGFLDHLIQDIELAASEGVVGLATAVVAAVGTTAVIATLVAQIMTVTGDQVLVARQLPIPMPTMATYRFVVCVCPVEHELTPTPAATPEL